MTLDEWCDLAPKDHAIFVLCPNGEHVILLPNEVAEGGDEYAPPHVAQILLLVGILADENDDLAEQLMERMKH